MSSSFKQIKHTKKLSPLHDNRVKKFLVENLFWHNDWAILFKKKFKIEETQCTNNKFSVTKHKSKV